jgi:hypothetical protein
MKLWYGIKDDEVQFAENETVLVEQGISNPKSFQIGNNGQVTGLDLQTGSNQSHQTPSQSQTA